MTDNINILKTLDKRGYDVKMYFEGYVFLGKEDARYCVEQYLDEKKDLPRDEEASTILKERVEDLVDSMTYDAYKANGLSYPGVFRIKSISNIKFINKECQFKIVVEDNHHEIREIKVRLGYNFIIS